MVKFGKCDLCENQGVVHIVFFWDIFGKYYTKLYCSSCYDSVRDSIFIGLESDDLKMYRKRFKNKYFLNKEL